MAEQLVQLDVVELVQDLAGRILGGNWLYPLDRVGEVLSRQDAQAFYEDASDGFDIMKNGRVYQITPLFGDDPVDDLPVTADKAADIISLTLALNPVIERSSESGRRKAVIFERQVA